MTDITPTPESAKRRKILESKKSPIWVQQVHEKHTFPLLDLRDLLSFQQTSKQASGDVKGEIKTRRECLEELKNIKTIFYTNIDKTSDRIELENLVNGLVKNVMEIDCSKYSNRVLFLKSIITDLVDEELSGTFYSIWQDPNFYNHATYNDWKTYIQERNPSLDVLTVLKHSNFTDSDKMEILNDLITEDDFDPILLHFDDNEYKNVITSSKKFLKRLTPSDKKKVLAKQQKKYQNYMLTGWWGGVEKFKTRLDSLQSVLGSL